MMNNQHIKALAVGIFCLASASSVEAGSGVLRSDYVRLDLGYGWQDVDEFNQSNLADAGGSFLREDFGDSFFAGAGIGWQLSNHVRFDLTGEYRFKTDVEARDALEFSDAVSEVVASSSYKGEYSAIVALANIYIDLPKIHNWITPYVGAGIGIAHNRFSGFDVLTEGEFLDIPTGARSSFSNPGSAGSNSETEFAWALMAGATFDIDERRKLDIGYRYLDLGGNVAASTSVIDCVCGAVGGPLQVSDLDAHEIRIGLRWIFQEPVAPVPLK